MAEFRVHARSCHDGSSMAGHNDRSRKGHIFLLGDRDGIGSERRRNLLDRVRLPSQCGFLDGKSHNGNDPCVSRDEISGF